LGGDRRLLLAPHAAAVQAANERFSPPAHWHLPATCVASRGSRGNSVTRVRPALRPRPRARGSAPQHRARPAWPEAERSSGGFPPTLESSRRRVARPTCARQAPTRRLRPSMRSSTVNGWSPAPTARHDFNSLPVVSRDGILVGVITKLAFLK